MKKSFLITLLVFLLSLCIIIPGYCRGELGDRDAFSTYIGKTRSEVRRIAPMFEEFENNLYCVDLIEEDDDILALAVMFDDYNLVESVILIVTKGAMKKMDIDDTLEMAASLGAVNFGFTSDSLIRSQYQDDTFLITIKGGITIGATQMSDETYMVMTIQK